MFVGFFISETGKIISENETYIALSLIRPGSLDTVFLIIFVLTNFVHV